MFPFRNHRYVRPNITVDWLHSPKICKEKKTQGCTFNSVIKKSEFLTTYPHTTTKTIQTRKNGQLKLTTCI